MVGRNVKLYDMVLQFLRTLFLRTRNVHYCTLRAELLMSLHDLDVGDICSVDPCHKVGAPGPLLPWGAVVPAPSGGTSGGALDPGPTALRRHPLPPHRLQGLSVRSIRASPTALLFLGSVFPLLQSPGGELCVLEQGFPHCPVLTWTRCDPPTASLGASWCYTL